MLTLPIVLWSDNDVSYVRSFAIMHAYQSGRGVYQRNSIPIVTKSRITFGIFLPLSCFWVELSALIFVCLFLLWNHLQTFKCRGRGSGSTGTAAASKSILAWEGGYLWRMKCPVWYNMSLSWHTRTPPILPQGQWETDTEVEHNTSSMWLHACSLLAKEIPKKFQKNIISMVNYMPPGGPRKRHTYRAVFLVQKYWPVKPQPSPPVWIE